MSKPTALAFAATLTLGTMMAVAGGPSAQALTMRECSAKYNIDKAAGTLNGATWNAYRKAQCGSGASAAVTTKPPSLAITGSANFPSAISPKYSKQTAGKARMHTCLDQYKANKLTNANGGLVWTTKGGGYYSECNKHLKG